MTFDAISVALTKLGQDAIGVIPNLIGAIIVLVIGLVLGKVLGRVSKEVLHKVKLDYYVSETHKPAVSLAGMFSLILRWSIYTAFIVIAVDMLKLPELTLWTVYIRELVPGIIGASVVMVVGYVLAEYIKDQLKKTGRLYSIVVGKILFFFIMYVGIATALPLLGITAPLVSNILLILIGAVGLGMAIALGLGLKDAIADVSKRYVRKMRV